MQILGLLGMYFDAAVVFVKKNSLSFRSKNLFIHKIKHANRFFFTYNIWNYPENFFNAAIRECKYHQATNLESLEERCTDMKWVHQTKKNYLPEQFL